MPLFAIPFPAIDPVAISLGPIAIRWYALAYIVGLLLGWRYCLALAGRPPHLVDRQDVDDFLVWATLGVVLGGRIGYVLFYKPGYYVLHPLEALYVWHGGMSFHGGALGVTIAILLFTRARKILVFAFSDIITRGDPDRSVLRPDRKFHQWRVVWPADPSSLGDGLSQRRRRCPVIRASSTKRFCEGILLFLLLFAAERLGARQRPGIVTGLFFAGYAVARMSGELFREPDPQLGFLVFGTTMGQLLSLPLLIAGVADHRSGRSARPFPRDLTARIVAARSPAASAPRARSRSPPTWRMALHDPEDGYYATPRPDRGAGRLHHRARNQPDLRRADRACGAP